MFTPRYFAWDQVGPVTRFEVTVKQGGVQLAGVSVDVGHSSLVQTGDTYTLDASVHAFTPPTIPAGVDTTFTVQAFNGSASSNIVESAPFTFVEVVPDPTNLHVL
jgi:hypothetical protein